MKRFRYMLMSLLLILVVSCETELPMPIVGYYRVSDYREQNEAYYYLALKEDGSFILYQAGGAASSAPFIMSGSWNARLSAFDFIKGEGTLTFTDVTGPDGVVGLALTEGEDNNYRFFWEHDRNTADATLSLKSLNKFYCKDISMGYNITEDEFLRVLENAGEAYV